MQTQIQAAAAFQKVLYLFVALRAAKIFVDFKKHHFWHPETESTGYFTAYKFCYECFHSMTGATEFHHIFDVVGSFGKSRKEPPRAEALYTESIDHLRISI